MKSGLKFEGCLLCMDRVWVVSSKTPAGDWKGKVCALFGQGPCSRCTKFRTIPHDGNILDDENPDTP